MKNRKSSSRGFTLVELLVVIGIIAVLISILLPSLARARQSANALACAANLKQNYAGLLFYAQEHKGKLPMGDDGNWAAGWVYQISLMLGSDPQVTGGFSKVLLCADAMQENPWYGWTYHVQGNVRAMCQPGLGDAKRGYQPARAYPLAGANDSSAKMLLWDSGQCPDFGNNAIICNQSQAGWQWWWGLSWAEPVLPGDMWAYNNILPCGSEVWTNMTPGSGDWIEKGNRDGRIGGGYDQGWAASQRYRHMGGQICNVLFFDGHVEGKRMGELHYRDMCITFR